MSDPTTAPTLQGTEQDDEDDKGQVFTTILSYIFLFFLIFGLSATVEIKNMRKQLTNKFAIGAGVAMQFFIMPLLGYLSVLVLKPHGFTKAMGISLLVVTSSPGGSYSNWWCSTFNAELALSVAMTTVSSLMSIGMLPANLLFYSWLTYGTDEEESIIEALDFGTLFISLGIVMAAIVLGLLAGYKWDNARFHELANRLGSISGLCLILFSIFISSGGESEEESNFWQHPWAFYVGVAFPCLLGISLANIISRSFRLSPPETVAISIECCYQNTGIATSVAITMFNGLEEAQAVAVPLLYGIVEAVVIGIYCVWAWKVGWTKAPADEKLCTVITKSYEINHEDNVHAHDHASDDDNDGEMQRDYPSTPSTQFENEAIVHAMETQTKQEHDMGGRGFWVHLRRLFKDSSVDDGSTSTNQHHHGQERPVELCVDPSTGSVESVQFTTPPKKDSNRRRMTSDYTADTAGSSTPSSLPSPQVSTERQFLYDSERTSI